MPALQLEQLLMQRVYPELHRMGFGLLLYPRGIERGLIVANRFPVVRLYQDAEKAGHPRKDDPQ